MTLVRTAETSLTVVSVISKTSHSLSDESSKVIKSVISLSVVIQSLIGVPAVLTGLSMISQSLFGESSNVKESVESLRVVSILLTVVSAVLTVGSAVLTVVNSLTVGSALAVAEVDGDEQVAVGDVVVIAAADLAAVPSLVEQLLAELVLPSPLDSDFESEI